MASLASPRLISNRYEIRDIIGRGGFGVVYRCFDHVTRTEIALKQMLKAEDSLLATTEANHTVDLNPDNQTVDLNPDNQNAAFDATMALPPLVGEPVPLSTFIGTLGEDSSATGVGRLALSNEFEMLARLRHPHIISVLDYGFDSRKLPFFTMPLLQAPRPITNGASDASFNQKVSWIAEMLQALAYLHHHKIIHRDLKPDNALLTHEGSVRVLDFGLATIRDHTLIEKKETITGTIPYMSPELLQGEPPTESSDLYALGIIAFELFAGYYPFEYTGMSDLITRIFAQEPQTEALDLDDPVIDWLDQLLEKDALYRPTDALEVLRELLDATQVQMPLETKTIQESYLQTAKFVGRKKPLGTLLKALRLSLVGDGSSWLIIGEEGVGKSRLLNEIRIRALVNGIQVLQGQGSQTSLTPYQVLRDPVRRLLLSTPIDDVDANVLKILLPDIEVILGRTIPDTVQDEVSKYANQLSAVILKLFQSQQQPTLLLLDDLHWAPESIEIIRNLVATVPHSNLMIVAATRPDEHSDENSDLLEMHPITLQRLSDKNMLALARSILGDVALRKDVRDLLQREASGNVNFLLEVIRALLEEVQQLRDIAHMRLPEEIAAGGIDRVLLQRLTKLEADDRQLFHLLAVTGLQIDMQLSQYFANRLSINHENWLARLTNFGIIDREGTSWEIAHERLRKVDLEAIPQQTLPALHSQVADALEQVYSDNVEKAAMIAYHWQEANKPEREIEFLLHGADYALRMNVFQDAARMYRRALSLQGQVPPEAMDVPKVQIKLGESLIFVEVHDEAREHVKAGLMALPEAAYSARAHALSLLADIAWRTGQFDEGQEYGQQALSLALDVNETELVVRSLSRLGLLASEKGAYTEAAAFYDRGLELAQAHQDDVGLTILNNNYGVLAYAQGDYMAAKDRFEASLTYSQRHGWTYRLTNTLINLGSVVGVQGEIEKANEYFERSLEMARAIGDRRGMTVALNNLGFVAQLLENYEQAYQYLNESLQISQSTGNRPSVAHTLNSLGNVLEKMGDMESAQEHLRLAFIQARDIQALPTCLKALADLARVEADPAQSAIWAYFVLEHDSATQEANEIAELVIEGVRTDIDDTTMSQYKNTAHGFTIETILTPQ